MGARDYSATASDNLSVGGISIAEGWLPSSVNNAYREGMADLANLLLDQGGGTTTTGSANAYLLDLPSAPSSYADNFLFVCKLHAAVTGPSTINVSGMGVKAFKKLVNGVATDLAAGDGPAGHRPVCIYSSADNAVLMLLAAPTFTHNGDDAISWPIQDRMKEQVYLLDFIPQAEHQGIRDGDLTYDCSDALEAAIASVSVLHQADIVSGTPTTYLGGPEIIFPYGHCYFDRTIELKRTVTLTGAATSGGANAHSSRLVFKAGITGIVVNFLETYNGGVTLGTQGANGSVIRNLRLTSLSAGAPFPDDITNGYDYGVAAPYATDHWVGHGIWARTQCHIEQCMIQSFPRCGLYIVAASSTKVSKPEIYGNCNCLYAAHLALYSNGACGLYIDGMDANACTFIAINANTNRLSGIYDSALIGNMHLGHHCDQNHKDGMCSYSSGGTSRRYITIDDTRAATIPPAGHAESEEVWNFIQNSPADPDLHDFFPPWPNEEDFVTPKVYRRGHPYWLPQASATAMVLINPYTEAGQCSTILNGTVIGNMPFTTDSSPTFIRASGAIGTTLFLDSRAGSDIEFTTTFNRGADESITWQADGDHVAGLAMVMDNTTDGCWSIMHARSTQPMRFTTNLTTLTGGLSTEIAAGHVLFPRGIFLGDSETNIRKITSGTLIPVSGEHAAGEIVLNSAPLPGEPWGWRCILGGTPGTWQPLRDTGSQQTISDGRRLH